MLLWKKCSVVEMRTQIQFNNEQRPFKKKKLSKNKSNKRATFMNIQDLDLMSRLVRKVRVEEKVDETVKGKGIEVEEARA